MSSASRVFDTINECLSLVQSSGSTHEAQEKGLQTLAAITKVSPQNRTLLAQTEGAIPTLATLTNAPSPIIQTLSLLTLFNLSLNPDLKQPLADMETIYCLNSLISSSSCSLDSSKLASSLICSLAMLDKNKAKFGVAGNILNFVPYCLLFYSWVMLYECISCSTLIWCDILYSITITI